MNESLAGKIVRAVDDAMVPGMSITQVRLSKDMFPVTRDDLMEVERRYRASGQRFSCREGATVVDLYIEPFEIGG